MRTYNLLELTKGTFDKPEMIMLGTSVASCFEGPRRPYQFDTPILSGCFFWDYVTDKQHETRNLCQT